MHRLSFGIAKPLITGRRKLSGALALPTTWAKACHRMAQMQHSGFAKRPSREKQSLKFFSAVATSEARAFQRTMHRRIFGWTLE